MNLIVKNNISCRTYYFEQESSRTYIIDEERHCKYLLEGVASDLWYVLYNHNDYEVLFEYAKKHDLLDEIDSFIQELINSNLIITSNPSLEPSIASSIVDSSILSTDFESFDEEQETWLCERNLLCSLTLQLSYKCNLYCKHCFNDKHHNQYEISLEEAKKAIDQAYQIGAYSVGLTGGECTFSKNFIDIARYIREKHLSLSLITNGLVLYDNPNILKELISLFPHQIKLSVYSMDSDIHDSITGVKGSLFKTLSVIRELVKTEISVGINFLQTKQNLGSLSDVLKFGKEVGVAVNVSHHFINNPQNNNASLCLSSKELENLFLDKEYPLSAHNLKKLPNIDLEQPICKAGSVYLSVSPLLDVQPCNDFDYPLGNLKSESMIDIWNVKVPQFKRKFTKRFLQKECNTHEYCQYCMYCPVHACYESGFLKRSKSSCQLAIARYNVENKLQNQII